MKDNGSKARLSVKLSDVILAYTNSAPDFISIGDDKLRLSIDLQDENGETIHEQDEQVSVTMLKQKDENDPKIKLKNGLSSFDFDISVDEIMAAWMGRVEIIIHNKHDNYLSYKPVSATIELTWFQLKEEDEDYHSLSQTKKSYNPVQDDTKQFFTKRDIEICAEMIGKAVAKIDLRSRGALSKFNTDDGRLEPIIITMAEKLGFVIEALELEEIRKLETRDINVSHSIKLKD